VLGADDRRKEITGSRRRLERVIGGPVSAFSYPFGAREDYGRAAVRVVREAGYQLACSSAPGVVDARASRLELPRLFVRDMPGDALERRLLRLVRTGA
jgi:peptidoglycan/xylan/chitin deacetylase (PgdA/CDA1 family)